MSYPKITVVTPSYNQGFCFEKTILSVLNQNYPNLEYIVMDGGSTDNSVDLIKKYEDKIHYWVSEKDKGQADALRKGFEKSTGDILCWLNSDDTFEPQTLLRVANWYKQLPSSFILTGYTRFITKDKIVWEAPVVTAPVLTKLNYSANDLLRCWEKSLAQPSTFWSREVLEKIGNINDQYFFAMDLEYWLRAIGADIPLFFVDETYSNFLYHDNSKSMSLESKLWKDLESLSLIYLGEEADQKRFIRDLEIYKKSYFCLKQANELASDDKRKSIELLYKGVTQHLPSSVKYFRLIVNTLLKLINLRH